MVFGGQVQRFSDLQRLIEGVSQKMLAQQLRQMEEDGLVVRTVHPEDRRERNTASLPGARSCARRWRQC
jgi:DNA-binding HxlR family transcriptional regulator